LNSNFWQNINRECRRKNLLNDHRLNSRFRYLQKDLSNDLWPLMTKFNLSLFKNFSLKKFKANHKTNNTSLFSEVAEFLQTWADASIAK